MNCLFGWVSLTLLLLSGGLCSESVLACPVCVSGNVSECGGDPIIGASVCVSVDIPPYHECMIEPWLCASCVTTDLSGEFRACPLDFDPPYAGSFLASIYIRISAVGYQEEVIHLSSGFATQSPCSAIHLRMAPICLERTVPCGDADGTGGVSIGDAVYLVNYLFVPGSPPPLDYSAGDLNMDGVFNLTDIVYLINFIFFDGPAPCD